MDGVGREGDERLRSALRRLRGAPTPSGQIPPESSTGQAQPGGEGLGPDPSPGIGPDRAQRRGLAPRPGWSLQAPVAAPGDGGGRCRFFHKGHCSQQGQGPQPGAEAAGKGGLRAVWPPLPSLAPPRSSARAPVPWSATPYGDRERDFSRDICTFNFKLSFVYLSSFKREPVAWSGHLAQASSRSAFVPRGRFAPA